MSMGVKLEKMLFGMWSPHKVKLAVNAVRENNGNKTLAARSLCISRAYLHRLIRLAEPDQLFEQNLRDVETA